VFSRRTLHDGRQKRLRVKKSGKPNRHGHLNANEKALNSMYIRYSTLFYFLVYIFIVDSDTLRSTFPM